MAWGINSYHARQTRFRTPNQLSPSNTFCPRPEISDTHPASSPVPVHVSERSRCKLSLDGRHPDKRSPDNCPIQHQQGRVSKGTLSGACLGALVRGRLSYLVHRHYTVHVAYVEFTAASIYAMIYMITTKVSLSSSLA